MADLKTTAEERAFAVQCRSCFGRGMRDPTCFRCDDSTEDHECPPEVTCGACKGSGDNPEVRLILNDLDTLLAENEGLSGVVRALSGAEAACIAERKRLLAERESLRAALHDVIAEVASEDGAWGGSLEIRHRAALEAQ